MKLNYKTSISAVKPSEIEFGSTTVYLRKDISEIKNDDTMVLWSYQEAALSLEEFKQYSSLAPQNLDNNQLVIMEAIADLYDKISSIQGGLS